MYLLFFFLGLLYYSVGCRSAGYVQVRCALSWDLPLRDVTRAPGGRDKGHHRPKVGDAAAMAHGGGRRGEKRGGERRFRSLPLPFRALSRRSPEARSGLGSHHDWFTRRIHTMYESVSVCSSGVSLLQGRPTRSQPNRKKQAGEKKVDKGKIPRGVGKERKEGSPD
ncbi:hypothetical protein BO85DRAFT_294701 [Aspergillus piperis CBS 112811]|uniref:Secreted protein n=1 Tax=Aspergillus piperis CBS 112811 TaxID=1448313 RepID=A0A8G1R2P2_9EURO|nr:hypothetical protein BO85DRAFT_294701 [Aspergillus piperis CBS 112811]RAH58067.1 hypothetical protein BO85DRAFT_294701 [Aspergillus piperis CBS 112811]